MKTLNANELKSMLDRDEDLTLINVLGEEDFRRAHVPGSSNIPVDRENFVSEVERLAGGKDGTVVVYCASHDCEASPKAARRLDEAGFAHVYDFEGGIKEWMKAGFEVAGEREKTGV